MAKAKEFIPQLCYALQNEDVFLSNEDIRDRIKKDLIDIWSKTTIQNNIPDEFKDMAKQAAKEKADQKKEERYSCIMSTGYYKIHFNERMEMTKIAC